MSSLVIVAIPREDDLVWKISSEKVPHLTLMYLGETEDANHAGRMAQFVQHALNINEHGPFYLDVDYRGELGDDKADVLFFENGWDSKWIKSLRGQLLKQNDIRTAFESADQFPEWVPHLTLGFPNAPAKELDERFDGRIYSVCFDRIAVWIGDYEGPEFRLKWPERTEIEDVAVAYSAANDDETVADILEHYGTKGMRWGVRNDKPVGEGANSQALKAVILGPAALLSPTFNKHTNTRTKLTVGVFGLYSILDPTVHEDLKQASKKVAIEKADKQWEKGLADGSAWVAVNNKVADHFNAGIGNLNKKHPDDFGTDTKNFDDPKTYGPKYKKYMDDVHQLTADSITKASSEMKLDNASGTKKVVVEPNAAEPSTFRMRVEEVKHAAEPTVLDIHVKYKRDTDGRVSGFTVDDGGVMHSATGEVGEEFILEHFGTKGMRWGHRKEQLKTGAKAVGRGLEKVGTALGDADFENATKENKETGEVRARTAIEEKATEAFHRTDMPKINAKPEYEKARKLRNRLRHPRDPLTKQYRKEVKEAYISRLETAANSMTNTSGTREYTIRERGWELPEAGGALPTSKVFWDVSTRPRAAQHAADNFEGITTLEVMMDEDGFITGLERRTSEEGVQSVPAVHSDIQTVHGVLMHRVELGEEFVKHYGTKGMKWGQRKAEFKTNKHNRRVATEEALREKRPAEDVRAYGTIGSSKRKKASIDTKGGFDHPPTEDAIKVDSHRQKMKKSGVKALSNKELQEVAARLNLEQQVHTLESKQPKSLGKKFVEGVLNMGSGGKGKKNQGGAGGALGGMAVKKLMKVAF